MIKCNMRDLQIPTALNLTEGGMLGQLDSQTEIEYGCEAERFRANLDKTCSMVTNKAFFFVFFAVQTDQQIMLWY